MRIIGVSETTIKLGRDLSKYRRGKFDPRPSKEEQDDSLKLQSVIRQVMQWRERYAERVA